MFRHDQMTYLRERIAVEDRLAIDSPSTEARRVHADLSFYYRAEMQALRLRQQEHAERQALRRAG